MVEFQLYLTQETKCKRVIEILIKRKYCRNMTICMQMSYSFSPRVVTIVRQISDFININVDSSVIFQLDHETIKTKITSLFDLFVPLTNQYISYYVFVISHSLNKQTVVFPRLLNLQIFRTRMPAFGKMYLFIY